MNLAAVIFWMILIASLAGGYHHGVIEKRLDRLEEKIDKLIVESKPKPNRFQ